MSASMPFESSRNQALKALGRSLSVHLERCLSVDRDNTIFCLPKQIFGLSAETDVCLSAGPVYQNRRLPKQMPGGHTLNEHEDRELGEE
eukprot:3901764-Rhodomonas_salina.2